MPRTRLNSCSACWIVKRESARAVLVRDDVPLSSRSSLSRERGEKAGDRGDRLERSERGGDRGDRLDRARTPATKRSFSKEVEERSRERPSQPEGLRKAASLTEDRDRGRDAGKGLGEEGKVSVWAGLGPSSPQTVFKAPDPLC